MLRKSRFLICLSFSNILYAGRSIGKKDETSEQTGTNFRTSKYNALQYNLSRIVSSLRV